MKIRSIKYTAAGFLALGSFTLPSCKQEKPNIIFILADEHQEIAGRVFLQNL